MTGKHKKINPGWIPNYHGAWAMITVPIILGIILSGFVWEHLLLLGLWWVGYFAFFATGLWLRSRRRARYFPPVRTYGLILVPFALGVLLTASYLAWWIPLFLPLIAITAWASSNRKDRSLINNAATVGAAALTLPVAYDMGTGGTGGLWGTGLLATVDTSSFPSASANGVLTGWPWVWLVTLIVAWYFLGTIFYVKTNIRERGERAWLIASFAFHLLGLVVVTVLASKGIVSWWHAALWLIIAARAIMVPTWGYYRGWLPAIAIGIGEISISIALMVTILI